MNVKTFLLVSTAVVFISFGVFQVHEARASTTRSFTLYASYVQEGWSFTSTINDTTKNPTIVVEQGDLVNLTLISRDGVIHQFFLSYTNSSTLQAGDPASVSFSSSTSFLFNATSNVGTYTYYCYYHPQILHGYFKVVPTGSIPEFQPFMMVSIMLATAAIAVLARKRKV